MSRDYKAELTVMIDQARDQRRALAVSLSEPYKAGETERFRHAFLKTQALIAAAVEAIDDEDALKAFANWAEKPENSQTCAKRVC